MPELPEVETLVQGLKDVLIGRRIVGVELHKPKMWQGKLSDEIKGHVIKDITRIAKLMVFSLSGDLKLLIHLKMTGQLIFEDKKGHMLGGGHPDEQFALQQPSKYTHIIFSFEDGSKLYFNDMRQFGYAKLISASELTQHKFVADIGIDPFVPQFTVDFLHQQLQKRPKITVKQVLMDQTVIAGIGNIYADESLFDAKILPTRKASAISEDETKELHQSILKILKKAIDFGGTSYKDFVHHSGKKGTMQDHLMVYRRAGQKCKRCGGTIKRIIIGGRGTHFCPDCQH